MQFNILLINHNLPFTLRYQSKALLQTFKDSSDRIIFITFQCRGRDNGSICHIHQRLNDVHVKHTIFLPQVQHTYNFTLKKKKVIPPLRYFLLSFILIKYNSKTTNKENLVILWAAVKVLKGICEVLQESGPKYILVNTKLMP